MAIVAITPVMRPDESHCELFEARLNHKQNESNQTRAMICNCTLRKYFNLPKRVTELWLTAHDTPVTEGLRVILKRNRPFSNWVHCHWVHCHVVDEDAHNNGLEMFDTPMDAYIIKKLRLKTGKPKTLYITCEYR